MGLFWVSYGILWLITLSLILVILLILRQFGMVYLKTAGGVSRGGLGIGTRVPAITFPTLQGGEVALASLAPRRPLLIFTSPRCAPCKALLPHISQFTKQHREIPVILFSMDATVDETSAFVDGEDLDCTVVSLPTRELYAEVFEGEVTPFAFWLDDRMSVAGKGLVNDFEDLLHITNYRKAEPRSAS